MTTKFEEFLETQAPEVKDAYAEHIKGLKTALESERKLHGAAKDRASEVELNAIKQIETLTTERDGFKTAADTVKAQLEAQEALAKSYEAKSKKLTVDLAIFSEATKKNFAMPEDAIAFIKLEDVKFSDDGKPVNVGELVEKLSKERAHLIKQANGTPVPPVDDKTTVKGPKAHYPVI